MHAEKPVSICSDGIQVEGLEDVRAQLSFVLCHVHRAQEACHPVAGASDWEGSVQHISQHLLWCCPRIPQKPHRGLSP